ncbi:enediyne antibiotic chromoprotein [Saccharothrix obliqua]|uniref:enediyne antibiotic chromoprotein n=1 Tax=Saccharothrix obliqua TaxID=2861747 RepID=UPI001C6046F9|nr:enediyne antibiotic chromoprotein [Saccharothrix obliqua]MBW4721861.1 hypothetical protein [Saccharothrix obliqua]
MLQWKTALKTSAALVAAAGFALTLGTPASAAASAAVSVSPATGLADGATVTVSASGFATSTSATALQCAILADGKGACNVAEFHDFNLSGGAGSTSVVVRRSFTGYVMPDGPEVGTVDCDTAPGGCQIVVGGNTGEYGNAAISFG